MADNYTPGSRAETLLTELNASLLNLSRALTAVSDPGPDPMIETCRDILRRTLVAQMLAERHMIAVAGTTGTGKTRLVQAVYGIGPTWLRSVRGPGERMPIFVVEDSTVTEPRGYLIEMADGPQGQRSTRRVEAATEAWNAGKEGGGRDLLALELRVPARLFPDAEPGTAGLLLLPGYEPETEQNRFWLELMRQALVGSARVLLVTHSADLATNAADSALADLRRTYLAGVPPLIAVTHCDTAREPDKLAQTAADRYQRSVEGVFCVGIGERFDGAYDRLREALAELIFSPGMSEATRLRELEHLLEADLAVLVNKAEARLDGLVDGRHGDDDRAMRDVMRQFDRGLGDLRQAYLLQLKGRVEEIRGQARAQISELHTQQIEGWAKMGRRVKARISLRPSVVTDAQVKLIEEAWNGTGFGRWPVSAELPNILAAAARSQLEPVFESGFAWSTPALSLVGGPDGVPAPTALKPGVDRLVEVMKMIQLLDRADSPGVPSAALQNAVEFLPALTLEWAHLGSVWPEFVGVELPENGPERTAAELAEALTRQLKGWDQAQRGLLKVWAGLAGIEAAEEVDTIRALIEAASGRGATALGSAVATVVSGSVTGLMTAVITLEMVNRSLTARRSAAEAAVDRIAATEVANRTAAFDQLMAMARRVLAAKLTRRYHLDRAFAERESLRWSIQTIKVLRTGLLEELRDDLRILG